MWQPDGRAQTRIGVLTPHADVWRGGIRSMAEFQSTPRVFFSEPIGREERWTRPSPPIPYAPSPTRHWLMTRPNCSHRPSEFRFQTELPTSTVPHLITKSRTAQIPPSLDFVNRAGCNDLKLGFTVTVGSAGLRWSCWFRLFARRVSSDQSININQTTPSFLRLQPDSTKAVSVEQP
jgi:hypothetical protein